MYVCVCCQCNSEQEREMNNSHALSILCLTNFTLYTRTFFFFTLAKPANCHTLPQLPTHKRFPPLSIQSSLPVIIHVYNKLNKPVSLLHPSLFVSLKYCLVTYVFHAICMLTFDLVAVLLAIKHTDIRSKRYRC
jgi:hypothetical protein